MNDYEHRNKRSRNLIVSKIPRERRFEGFVSFQSIWN
jgi:hypothetical protein